MPTKRASKKAEAGVALEALMTTDDLERNQKIMQWMMEGEKEAGRQKRSPYGYVSQAPPPCPLWVELSDSVLRDINVTFWLLEWLTLGY